MSESWEGSPSYKDNERSRERLTCEENKGRTTTRAPPFICQFHTHLNTATHGGRRGGEGRRDLAKSKEQLSGTAEPDPDLNIQS